MGKHINNVLKEELSSFSVIANFATTENDGKVYQGFGKEWFAFSKMKLDAMELINNLSK